MSTTTLTAKATAYLETVREGLSDLSAEERYEVLQDLESHLIELGDIELGDIDIEARLGTPGDFVAEFRASAGLDQQSIPARFGRLQKRLNRIQASIASGLQHPWVQALRPRLRALQPAWIWMRGWLVVSLFALIQSADQVVFSRFPIPYVGFSTTTGLALTVIATWASLRLNRARGQWSRFTHHALTAAAGLAVLVAWLNPVSLVEAAALSQHAQAQDPYADYGYALIGPNGGITNIHAFDEEGNPVNVLLYDQDGNPIAISGELWFDGERLADSYGPVQYGVDAYGQPITNLYPLTRFGEIISDTGAYATEEIPPPRVAFPTFDDPQDTGTTEGAVTTPGG